ncbi:MAG: ribonuclease III [Coriobacteriia bacterium]|nr:ribonuclease III [Coriobacteriia bacterium]
MLEHQFADRTLVLHALTHPSAVEERAIDKSYERLEFLGDSYLGAIVADMLYRRFPDLDEGGMTRVKISLVSGESLSRRASELGIGDLILFGSSEHGTGKRGLHSALENVFEALVAALVLDAGFAVAQEWVTKALGEEISIDQADEPDNPKSNLQELLQEQHITPTYELVATEGPAHDRTFTSRVLAEGKELAVGIGHSKKAAESAAAACALALLRGQHGQGHTAQHGQAAPHSRATGQATG